MQSRQHHSRTPTRNATYRGETPLGTTSVCGSLFSRAAIVVGLSGVSAPLLLLLLVVVPKPATSIILRRRLAHNYDHFVRWLQSVRLVLGSVSDVAPLFGTIHYCVPRRMRSDFGHHGDIVELPDDAQDDVILLGRIIVASATHGPRPTPRALDLRQSPSSWSTDCQHHQWLCVVH